MKPAAIVKTRGCCGWSTTRNYQLRSGRLGTGRNLAEHRAAGAARADDQAMNGLVASAEHLGYMVVSFVHRPNTGEAPVIVPIGAR